MCRGGPAGLENGVWILGGKYFFIRSWILSSNFFIYYAWMGIWEYRPNYNSNWWMNSIVAQNSDDWTKIQNSGQKQFLVTSDPDPTGDSVRLNFWRERFLRSSLFLVFFQMITAPSGFILTDDVEWRHTKSGDSPLLHIYTLWLWLAAPLNPSLAELAAASPGSFLPWAAVVGDSFGRLTCRLAVLLWRLVC